MRPIFLFVVFALPAIGPAGAQTFGDPLADPWYAEYGGSQAAGKHVLGLWQFNAGGETEDASGHKLGLELQGATIGPGGRFGGCLESFRGTPVEDVRHRAWVKCDPRLSPAGAFTLEMWIRPKPEWADYPDCFLLDKKYVAHDDYQLVLGPADAAGRRVLRACLGFGGDSETWYARPARFEPGTWYHVAFTYDANGTGGFFIGGVPYGSTSHAGRKQISPGKHGLSIGDRIGSLYHGFPGYIDQVRICDGTREFRRVKLERISPRTCFVRMESGAELRLAVTNLQSTPLGETTVRIEADGMAAKEVKLDGLAPGGTSEVVYPLDTSLRPDAYTVVARLSAAGDAPLETREEFTIRLVPRQPPGRFPVVMWGVYGNVTEELPRLKAMGFTHALGLGADYDAIWRAGEAVAPDKPDRVAQNQRMLDEALAADFSILASLSPGAWLRNNERFLRVDRQGKPAPDKKKADVCGLFPEIAKFCNNVGRSVGKAYGPFPSFAGALIHTEVRDHAYPCFHPHDVAAYRQFAGADIPAEVGGPHGVDYTKLPGFPESRVIPDDHPLYVYYRWYWKHGDGWNALNTAVHEGLQSAGGGRLWTFHDPAARAARVYGSGGGVDVLSQWTYSYPDPIRIGLATDELLALAAGARPPQQVMKMTQIIWYRSQTAPRPAVPRPGEKGTGPCFRPTSVSPKEIDSPKNGPVPVPALPPAVWEQQQPDAPFITIAPMHLREAFWTKIARPIRGIMYHGWQSLVPCEPAAGYRYTHPQTQHELARLTAQVIRPLGPTLLEVPAAPGDVAFLESFASEMFARRGTYGWGGGWAGDAYHVLEYAHLQPDVVLDETIIQRGLDGYRVLVMCDCDVITQSMLQRIQAFQAAGGLIVGDDRIAPAVRPDIVLHPVARTGRADEDKAALLALAAELRQKLAARFTRHVDSSSPEVIPYLRRYRNTDYVFLVNDRREFGRYVGQHGLVMENGLPSRATITLARPAGFAYDLTASLPVPLRAEQGKLTAEVELGPCDGRLLMVTPRAIESVEVQGPAAVDPGQEARLTIHVLDSAGQPVEAVVPMEVTVRDPEGRQSEGSGYYAAVGGRLTLTLQPASNDVPGVWTIEARELASGRRAAHYPRLRGPEPRSPSRKPIPKDVTDPVQPKG